MSASKKQNAGGGASFRAGFIAHGCGVFLQLITLTMTDFSEVGLYRCPFIQQDLQGRFLTVRILLMETSREARNESRMAAYHKF